MNHFEKMKNKISLIILFLVAIAIRLSFNFADELIAGVNGGYYALQVREILENGQLAFADMPLLFYFDALLIKIISFFAVEITDVLIITVVKIIDSVCFPFIVFPIYKIYENTNSSAPWILKFSIIAFSVLSFTPLILIADLQKNTLSIVFLFFFIEKIFSYQTQNSKKQLIFAGLFLIFITLTHFGTFVFALFLICIYLIFTYRKKSIIPIFVISVAGLLMIWIFDSTRFYRLISFASVLFEKPALLHQSLMPPDIIIILISWLLSGIGLNILRKKADILNQFRKNAIISCIICLIICSFPLLDAEYFKRLSLFLFIPQILLITQISTLINLKQQKRVSIFLIIFTTLSFLAVIGNPKKPVIEQQAFFEIKELKNNIISNDKTIIVARHGLEWWLAWKLKTKVAQDKAIDSQFFEKYDNIYFVKQINGFTDLQSKTVFHEPQVPENSELVFSGINFEVYNFSK